MIKIFIPNEGVAARVTRMTADGGLGLPWLSRRATGLVSGAKPLTRHSATSPAARTTAPGVPVATMSPGSSGMTWLMKASRRAGLNRMSATRADRTRSPFR